MNMHPTALVRIVSIQTMMDPWTGETVVAVLYEGTSVGCLVMLSEERCAELNLREAMIEGSWITAPDWRG